MSHFTVLVIGENPERLLAPFHEFECTGRDDEFVVDIDKTVEYQAEFAADTTSRLVSPSGERWDPYDDMFYRDPTPEELAEIGPIAGSGCCRGFSYTSRDWADGKGYRPKIHFTPDGYEEIEVLTSEVQTFEEWCNDYYGKASFTRSELNHENGKYGYVLIDDVGEVIKVVKRTNPKAKWDWYQIGGRWSGFFRLKEGAKGKLGERSLLDRSEDKRAELRGTDQCLKGDVDFEAMRNEAKFKAIDLFDKYDTIKKQFPELKGWKEIRESYGDDNIDQARKAYREQPGHKELDDELGFQMGCWVDELSCGREAYIEQQMMTSFQTYAMIKDGEWFERGEMGWFGMASNEKDLTAWNKEFLSMLESLSDDTLLTIVDCHI